MDEITEVVEQVNAEAAELEESATSEQEVTEESGEQTAATPQKAKGVQKRLDELTREKYEERRRADHLAAMLEQTLAAQRAPAQQKEEVQFQPTRPKPTLADFDFDTEKFAEELTEWKLEQREEMTRKKNEQQQEAERTRSFEQSFEEKRAKTLAAGTEKYPDFEDVISSLPGEVMHIKLASAILETGAPADVAYYLGKNPQEAERISRLDPFRMAIEIGRIEGKATVAPPPKKPSAAPPPVNPLNSNAPAGAEPDAKTHPKEWLAWERKRCAALNKRY